MKNHSAFFITGSQYETSFQQHDVHYSLPLQKSFHSITSFDLSNISIFYVDILMELFVLKDLLFCCHLWMFRLFISRCTTSISLFHVSIDSRLVMCRMWDGIMVMSNPSTIRKDLVLSTQSMSYRMISFNIMEVGRMVR